MSLISEALRKARAEQRRREIERGVAPAPLPALPPPRTGFPFFGVLAASLLSALVAAFAVWLLTRTEAPSPPQPEPAAGLVPNPPQAASAPSPPAKPKHQTSGPSALPETRAPAQATPPPTPKNLQPPTPEGRRSPSPPGPYELVVEGQVDGVTLHLDFLVYGAGRSFASINGQEVRPGSAVDGFVVEQILEDRVLLGGPKGKVVLKVR